MSSRPTPIVPKYAIALTAALGALGLGVVVRDYLAISASPVILIGLIIAAWYGGRWPGVFYCVLADLTVDYFLEDPRYQMSASPTVHAIRLSVLITVSLIITSLRDAKIRLEIRARQQAAVAELGRLALSGTALQELLSDAVRIVTDVLRVQGSAVCRVDSEKQEMNFAASEGWSADLKGQGFS